MHRRAAGDAERPGKRVAEGAPAGSGGATP
jgi:hypothetical protein